MGGDDYSQGNEAIRYLEVCVQKLDNHDQAIHNFLLSLYAKLQPDNLMTYLQLQGEVRTIAHTFFTPWQITLCVQTIIYSVHKQ